MNYWTERFSRLEEQVNAYGQETYRQIDNSFGKAQAEMQKEIDVWYARIARNNEISIADARKLLSKNELKEFKWDVQEYIKYGQENALNQKWVKELENASAKFHINRLEALKIRTQHIAEKAFGNEVDLIDGLARKAYTENYYRSIYEVQKGFGIGFTIGEVDENKLNKIITKPWAPDGKDFSSRIWGKKSQMVDELHKEMTRICILGGTPDNAIKAMSRFVDSKFKNAKVQAGRLVMTESAFFASTSQRDAFNELGVEEFEIVATLDSRTSPICQTMDGKHFPMSEFKEGVTAPPFHVWCRSTTCPYFNDEFTKDDLRASRKEGNTEYVPANMKYGEWKEKYVRPEDPKWDGLDVLQVSKINLKNEDEIKTLLDTFEKEYVAAKEEYALIITQTGDTYKVKGQDNFLNIGSMGDIVKGAIITHNHPIKYTEFSFSQDDIDFFQCYELKYLCGFDEKYIYELSREGFPSDPIIEIFAQDMTFEEYRHSEVQKLVAELNISYRRRKR